MEDLAVQTDVKDSDGICVASSRHRHTRHSSTEIIWADFTKLAIETLIPGEEANNNKDCDTVSSYAVIEVNESTHTHLYSLRDPAAVKMDMAVEEEKVRKLSSVVDTEKITKKS